MNGEQEIVEIERAGTPPRDGIGEEDNAIPLWFNVGFYGLIGVGIIYILYYLLSGWSSLGEYAEASAAAAEQRAALAAAQPSENPFRGDAAAIAEGREVFTTICAACHKPDGSGLVGPSLVDPYWKYGHGDTELFESVAQGRPGGMPPWLAQLGADKIWKALAYLETLPTSDVPGVGAPEPGSAAGGAIGAGG